MIFITSDIAIGSKNFMHDLAKAIRPALSEKWSAEEMEDFELSLLQEMIYFGDVSADDYNVAVDAVKNATGIDKIWQQELLSVMQTDPRYRN